MLLPFFVLLVLLLLLLLDDVSRVSFALPPPTLRFRRWLGAAKADAAYIVPDNEVGAVRTWLGREGLVLLLIPILAAMLARGIGY